MILHCNQERGKDSTFKVLIGYISRCCPCIMIFLSSVSKWEVICSLCWHWWNCWPSLCSLCLHGGIVDHHFVRFVYIGGIVDHHCLNFLSIIIYWPELDSALSRVDSLEVNGVFYQWPGGNRITHCQTLSHNFVSSTPRQVTETKSQLC